MSEARGLFAAQAEDNYWRANFGFPAEEFGESHFRRSRSRQCQPIIVVSRPDNYSCEEAPLHVPREDHTNREWSFKDTGYATRPLSRQVEIDSSGPRPRWPSPVMSEAR